MTRSDRNVRLELRHGGKFVEDNAYIGGKVDIVEDYDYCLFDYDELLFVIKELGYSEIVKCGFSEVFEPGKYRFVHNNEDIWDNIMPCINNELDEIKLYVEVGDVGEGPGDRELENEIDDGLEDNDFSSDDDEYIQARQILMANKMKEIQINDGEGTCHAETEANPSTINTDEQRTSHDNGYSSTYEDSGESVASLVSDGEVSDILKHKKHKLKVFAKNQDHTTLKFELGMIFKDCEECKIAINLWSILNGYNIKWKRGGGGKLKAICEDNCPWRLYASRLTRKPTCVIKTYEDSHTCVRANINRQVNSMWLANVLMEKLKRNPKYTRRDIQRDTQLTYGIIVTLMMCYRAKWRALQNLRESYEEHYSKLRSYVAALRLNDKERRFELKAYLDSENRPVFERIYIGFSSLRKGFFIGCRIAICLFLKDCHWRSIISCSRQGLQSYKMFPIAWIVIEKETEETWSWFFERLFEDLNISDGLGWTFMSGKQKGLINGIMKLAPNAEHRNCATHIYANWKKAFGGPKYKGLFLDVVKSNCYIQYMYKLNQMKAESAAAVEDFCNRGPHTFCKTLISTYTKCDLIDNNLCETFNSFILQSRDKPLIIMLEEIRKQLMSRMCKIAKSIEKSDDILCPNIRKKLEKIQNAVRFCDLILVVGEKFEVHYFDESYIVDLQARDCSCREWELIGIHCCHAMACIFYTREKPENYVDQFYYKSNYVKTYKHALIPFHGEMEWPFVNQPPILPPQYTKLPGRPKKNRRREQDEVHKPSNKNRSRVGIKMICTKCRSLGHNKRTCKAENPRVKTSAMPQNTMRRQRATTSSAHQISSTQPRLTRSEASKRRLTPGGKIVQYISGARAAAATISNLGSGKHERSQFADQGSSRRFEDGSNQNSQVDDSATPNPTS